MSFFNRLTAVVLAALLIGPMAPLEARTRKGDRFLVQGRAQEAKKDWDAALDSYGKALSEDPAELVYQMAEQRARFQAGQVHLDNGYKIRAQGQLGESLLEFQKSFAINPGSAVAAQEIRQTQEMIQRERKRVEDTGKEAAPEQRGLTLVEEMKLENQKKMDRMLSVPELKPLNSAPINLKINAQPVKTLFDTIGKIAGINVLWDPEYQVPQRNSLNVDFENSTLDEALDYVSVITKSYWKALSPNTIFVTNDNPNKRRDFAEMVAQTFYLSNVQSPQELQEIVNAVRSVSELQRVVAYNSQNAIIVRGESDQVALAGKMIHDLDKPKSEVVVDIMVIEASTNFSRQIATALASTSSGLNMPFSFTPRSSIQVQTPASSSTTTTGTTTASSTSGSAIPISQLGHISTADFSTSLPSALLQAALSDGKTKVMQAPQLRAVDNVKATLKIGEKEPTATGSFQPGIGGVGINPLVNTQFTFIDVGVNVEILTRVHENNDVSMHVDLNISTIVDHVNLGGIDQPVIGQRLVQEDIRMHEGEVNLIGGLIQDTDTKTVTGIPGLASIPLLRRLFTGENTSTAHTELMIAIIPHIVRRPEITPENLRGIAVGNATTIKLNYAPAKPEEVPAPKPAAAAQPAAGAPAVANAPSTLPAGPATQPALSPPATVPPMTAPAVAVPALSPPATAPPMTVPALAPPATAPPSSDAGQPAGGARVRFSPAQVDTSVSSNVTVVLSVEGGTDIAGAPMQIRFDPKVLRLNDVVRGDFMSSDGQMAMFTKSILNDTGTATVQLSRAPGTPGVSGSGVLLTLNFQAVGKGSTAVTLSNLALRNSQGQALSTGSPQLSVNVK